MNNNKMKKSHSMLQLLVVAALAVGLNAVSFALAKDGADDSSGGSSGSSKSSSSSSSGDSSSSSSSSKTRSRGSDDGASSSSRDDSSSSSSSRQNRGGGSSSSSGSLNSGPGSVNSGRNLENEVRGGENENEVRGRENENELRGRENENELRGRENEIENEIRSERQSRSNEMEIRRQDGSVERVRLQSEDALTHRSAVATAVLGLIETSRESELGDDRGLGSRISVIAQAQNDSRKNVADSLEQIETRNGLVEFVIGPDFEEIADVKEEIEANDARIEELQRIEGEIRTPENRNEIRQDRQLLQDENERLKVEIRKAEDTGSLLGWLVRRFSE